MGQIPTNKEVVEGIGRSLLEKEREKRGSNEIQCKNVNVASHGSRVWYCETR
jgi:hypothetical protein